MPSYLNGLFQNGSSLHVLTLCSFPNTSCATRWFSQCCDNIYSHLLQLVTPIFWVNQELESPEEKLICMIVLPSSHSYTRFNHLV